MENCALLTPKEVNLIIRSIHADQKSFAHIEFGQLLFEVRFELAKSRLMDTNIEKLSDYLVHEFAAYDTKKVSVITITEAKKALFNSKHTTLTPMQVFTLIGMAKVDAHGFLNYVDFSKTCRQAIDELFSMQSIMQKATLMEGKLFKPAENIEDIQMGTLELFDIFKKYDRNQNGFLEIHEYIQCLKDSQVALTENEIVTLGLAADINGDERIDFEEFMKHFSDCLRMIRLQSTLHNTFLDFQKQISGK